jgi:hypothetical protein
MQCGQPLAGGDQGCGAICISSCKIRVLELPAMDLTTAPQLETISILLMPQER